jgi:benzoyl-CoA reductase/2-hydroxyglutaryl-CoA dehydratase subunit BcrC/BadD/HgdB
MEDRLKRLVEANGEGNRLRWAQEWKRTGGKVIGIISSDVPEEIIHAAGMLPWHLTGTWGKDVSQARPYRGEFSCGYCTHVLEFLLSDQAGCLDGVVAADVDQDVLRLTDVIETLDKIGFCHLMHMPISDSDHNCRYFATEVRSLLDRMERAAQRKITDDSIRSSIEVYNKMRALLGKLYELRKREEPPLSGAEILGITTAARVMPKEQFNQELEGLLPYLETRKTPLKNVRPRVMVSSEGLDNPAYLSLIEENGSVVMDDMETGSRYFTGNVDTNVSDPVNALAQRYMTRHACSRMASWDRQVTQIIEWVKEYNVQGVISLPLAWCYPLRFRLPYLNERLQQAGIPSASFERDYPLTNIGQLRTRISAFMEMLAK